jgi:hypothetical protein
MPSTAVPPNKSDQPDEEKDKRRRETFSTLAKAYNEGCEQGGTEEGLRRLRLKLDELSPRPYKEREPLLDHFVQGA